MKKTALSVTKSTVIIFSLVSVILFFIQSIQHHGSPGGNDLSSYLNSARWLFEGENPYFGSYRIFLYPQFLLVILYPLSFLQRTLPLKILTAVLWSVSSYLVFFVTIFAAWNYTLHNKPWREYLKLKKFQLALIILLLFPFMQDEFINGQVNLLVVGAIAAYFFLLEKEKQFGAAFFIAMAASVKIAPGLCLLWALLDGKYKTVGWFVVLFVLFTVGLPYLVNSESLSYYKYYLGELLPEIARSESEYGFKSFSLISTLAHLFKLQLSFWVKLPAVVAVAIGLNIPVIWRWRQVQKNLNQYYRLTLFSIILLTIPLTFPMSESHHLLILTLPLVVIIQYWEKIIKNGVSFFKDKISLCFFISLVVLHIGQGLKQTPLRFLGLVGLYAGLVMLTRKLGKSSEKSQVSLT